MSTTQKQLQIAEGLVNLSNMYLAEISGLVTLLITVTENLNKTLQQFREEREKLYNVVHT